MQVRVQAEKGARGREGARGSEALSPRRRAIPQPPPQEGRTVRDRTGEAGPPFPSRPQPHGDSSTRLYPESSRNLGQCGAGGVRRPRILTQSPGPRPRSSPAGLRAVAPDRKCPQLSSPAPAPVDAPPPRRFL
ncbi:translation initiation factor IF-2-like [Monodelphis domestica]|uniref:translation initiation factor IF-2-like n=1 Tax=Monodelphis domestica TaxID=13616 RepID=UPI0024E1C2C3|nr:translation initiation factor IF-2-like [Monodelphis domestica]